MNILVVHRNHKDQKIPDLDGAEHARVTRSVEENKKGLARVLNTLDNTKNEITTLWRGDLSTEVFVDKDLVITIGGDGTLLEASHYITSPKTALMGLTGSRTSIGALCYGAASKFPLILPDIDREYPKLPIETMRIAVRDKDGKDLLPHLLNDVLFAHKSPAGLTRMVVTYEWGGGSLVKFPVQSSGIWISTHIGITGAIRSAGNLVKTTIPTSLIALVNNPQKIDMPDFANKEVARIRIKSLTKNGMIFGDGQFNTANIEYNQEITIEPGSFLKLYRR